MICIITTDNWQARLRDIVGYVLTYSTKILVFPDPKNYNNVLHIKLYACNKANLNAIVFYKTGFKVKVVWFF